MTTCGDGGGGDGGDGDGGGVDGEGAGGWVSGPKICRNSGSALVRAVMPVSDGCLRCIWVTG